MAEPAVSTKNVSPTLVQLRAFRELAGIFGRSQLNDLWADTFGEKRNVFKALGYKKVLRFRDYKARYDRDSIAGRIVDVPAHYTWRSPPTLSDGDSTNTAFLRDWKEIAERFEIWTRLEKVDRISRIGRYAVLVIGSARDKDLAKPMSKMRGPDDVAYLSVFSEGNAVVMALDNDPRSPRFGQPETYQIDLTRGLSTRGFGASQRSQIVPLANQLVHWSRCIHVAECIDEDEVFGVPALQRVWNLMDDLIKCVGGSAESFWKAADRGLQLDVAKDMEWNAEDKKDLEQQIDEYRDDMRRIFRTRGVTVTSLGSEGVNPRGVFAVVSSLVVGATGIPLRILFGPERGQFSLPEERAGFLQLISDRQIGYAEPSVLRRLTTRMVEAGAARAPTSGKYTATWPDILLPTDLELSQVANNYADAAQKFSKQSGETTVATAEARRFFPGLDPTKVPPAAPAPTIPVVQPQPPQGAS